MSADNPRFPHQCVIYRKVGVDSFNPDGNVVELYRGPCRKSGSNNIRTFNTGSNTTGKVDVADYRVSMPGVIAGLQKGDLVDVTDLIGAEKGLRVVNFEATRLGSWVTEDENGRRKTIAGGTAVLCNISSN